MSALPGAVGLSALRVYDWPAADGSCGGSPHVHLTCTEAYFVVSGEGRVETLTSTGFTRTPLAPGTVAWFTPGTVHRLVGSLRIVVLMQNGGLPEAGDAVFTFPPDVLADPERYARAAVADDPAMARRRRDLALEGFARLREDPAALEGFYRTAVRLKAPLFEAWERRWAAGALAEAERTGDHLRRLRAGDWSHLAEAGVRLRTPRPALGMCGHLDTYTDP